MKNAPDREKRRAKRIVVRAWRSQPKGSLDDNSDEPRISLERGQMTQLDFSGLTGGTTRK